MRIDRASEIVAAMQHHRRAIAAERTAHQAVGSLLLDGLSMVPWAQNRAPADRFASVWRQLFGYVRTPHPYGGLTAARTLQLKDGRHQLRFITMFDLQLDPATNVRRITATSQQQAVRQPKDPPVTIEERVEDFGLRQPPNHPAHYPELRRLTALEWTVNAYLNADDQRGRNEFDDFIEIIGSPNTEQSARRGGNFGAEG